MKEHCRTCPYFQLQVYDGQIQPIARCLHVGFLKAGLGKPRGVGEKPDVIRQPLMDRLPPEEIAAEHARGFFYYDLVDIKANCPRTCSHWRSLLTMAFDVLEHYGQDPGYVLGFPDIHPVVRGWIEAPVTRERVYERINRIHTHDYVEPEAPRDVLDGYDPCQACRYYRPDIAEDGTPVPYRGRCHRMSVEDAGVFSMAAAQETPVVYAFMGCTGFEPDPSYTDDPPMELPQRLTAFVETNPMTLRVADVAALVRMPVITKRRAVGQDEYDALLALDLTDTLRQRRGEIDFKQFASDMALTPVTDFFNAGLRRGTVEGAAAWKGYGHYKTAEDELFGDP